jgi:hypothetical protein
MKIKKILVLLISFIFFVNTSAQDTILVKDKTKDKLWYVPDYVKTQFAGNLGVLSVGVGYQFFNSLLYTELIYGYVPVAISKSNEIHLMSLKNTFPLFRKKIGNYTVSPIAGFTGSLETGNNSFLILPDKYPKGYYVPSAIHFTLFIGTLVHKDFVNSKRIKGIDFYYELGTVETYLWSAITSKEVALKDVFSSAIGINIYF